eukprot:3578127-Prymnesium_polylepis.1
MARRNKRKARRPRFTGRTDRFHTPLRAERGTQSHPQTASPARGGAMPLASHAPRPTHGRTAPRGERRVAGLRCQAGARRGGHE